MLIFLQISHLFWSQQSLVTSRHGTLPPSRVWKPVPSATYQALTSSDPSKYRECICTSIYADGLSPWILAFIFHDLSAVIFLAQIFKEGRHTRPVSLTSTMKHESDCFQREVFISCSLSLLPRGSPFPSPLSKTACTQPTFWCSKCHPF